MDASDLSEICHKVSERFSVNVEVEDVKNLPQFHFLLSDLCNHVEIGGVSKTIKGQLHLAEEKLLDAKSSYFQSKIIYDALDEVLKKFELKSLKQKTSAVETKLFSTMRNRLSCGEICSKYLPSDKDEDKEGFLGLTKDFVISQCDSADPKSVQGIILPEVEASVQKQCKSVMRYYGQDSNDYSTFNEMLKFSTLIQTDVTTLKEQKQKHFQNLRVIIKQIENYYECMVGAIRIMKELIELRSKEINLQSATAKFYAAKCEGISLKARILELQILNETYTEETVPALRNIQEELQTKESQVELDLAGKSNLLQQYTAVGASFNSLVDEYAQLTMAIENEKWALKELEKSEK